MDLHATWLDLKDAPAAAARRGAAAALHRTVYASLPDLWTALRRDFPDPVRDH